MDRAQNRWWRRIPLTRQAIWILTLAIGPLLLSLVLLGIASRRDAALDDQIAVRREVRLFQTELLKEMSDAETGVRGYLLTEEERFLGPYEEAVVVVPQLLERLEEHEHFHGDVGFRKAQDLAPRGLRILRKLVDRSGNQRRLLAEGDEVMNGFRAAIAELIPHEDQEITALREQRGQMAQLSSMALVGGGAVSVLGGILGGTLLMIGIVRRLAVVTENARRVAEGEELEHVAGGDEIAQLNDELERSARLLRARESELRQAKIEADLANQAKSDFISRMSHELRTPLNAILGFTQVLREDADDTAAEDLDQILRAGRHLLSLINEVLDLSRIESGHFAMSQEPVAVAEVVEECVELIRPLAAQRSITISNGVLPVSDLHVLADRQRLKQVYLNLLSNAVKYNRDGGRVELSCSAQENRIRLFVRDTGPGIAETVQDQLFVPFARLGAEATEVEGTGLGLALSLRLMQMMGGDMNLGESGPAGSLFWLELTTGDAHAVVNQIEEVEERHLPAAGGSGQVTVLQVEDNPTNIRLVQRILKRRPHVQLVTVQHGAAAVQAAQRSEAALVLLDVNLPDISGREVLARLRAEPATADIPVVMLSADATSKQIEKLLSAGAADYITKPLDVSHFLSVVDEILERRTAQ